MCPQLHLRPDPIACWAERYVYEEPIHAQREALAELRRAAGSEHAIARHVKEIALILDRLPGPVADRYRPWAETPSSFNYGAEGHYQKRILHLMLGLHEAGFPVGDVRESVWARQTIHPSGFNATPRIVRFGGFSYIVIPAPTTYWLYAICSMIAACGEAAAPNTRKLSLYIRYLVAARSFERWAEPATAYSLDYLVDEIVHRGVVEDVDSEEPATSGMTLNMVGAVEDFIICHELAHLVLDHRNDGSADVEAEADRFALDMLRAIPPARFGYFPTEGLEPRHFPQLGYLTLRMWTAVRLAAEQRVLPLVWDDAAQVEKQRRQIDAVWQDRLGRIGNTGLLERLETAQALRAVADGAVRLIEAVGQVELDPDETDRMRKLARSLARQDYRELVQRYGLHT